MHFIHCVAQNIPQHLDSQADLILFHAVLKWVVDPRAVLKTLWSILRPDDALSLMFYDVNGLLMRNMLVGNFGYVQQGMYKRKRHALSPDFPRDPQQVCGWLEEIDWEITGKTGVRVFHGYLRDKRKQHDCSNVLTEIETRYCRREPYISLGYYIHTTAAKRLARVADARIAYERIFPDNPRTGCLSQKK